MCISNLNVVFILFCLVTICDLNTPCKCKIKSLKGSAEIMSVELLGVFQCEISVQYVLRFTYSSLTILIISKKASAN